MKTIHLNTAGPARREQLAHGRFWPARSERKGSAAAWQGLGPWPLSAWPAWLAEAECLAGVRAGAAARLGHEAGGQLRPRQGAGRRARVSRRQGGAHALERKERGVAERGCPRRAKLRRGICGRRRLTMANRLEHRLRKVEAMLLARWRWLWRTGAVGTGNSGDGARRRRESEVEE